MQKKHTFSRPKQTDSRRNDAGAKQRPNYDRKLNHRKLGLKIYSVDVSLQTQHGDQKNNKWSFIYRFNVIRDCRHRLLLLKSYQKSYG